MTSRQFIACCAFCFPVLSFGQGSKTVQWLFKADTLAGNSVVLKFTANIGPGWHLYSQFLEEGGPIPTRFIFEPSDDYSTVGNVDEKGKQVKFRDETYEMEITWYSGTVLFIQKLTVNQIPTTIKGRVEYMTCNNYVCIPDKQDFSIDLRPPK